MIVIPAWAWRTAVDSLAEAPARAERAAFLDGVAGGRRPLDGGVVTTVTLPCAEDDEELAGRHLPAYGLVRLAQLHTHPPGWTADELTLS